MPWHYESVDGVAREVFTHDVPSASDKKPASGPDTRQRSGDASIPGGPVKNSPVKQVDKKQ
jgi:hypothetical protein